MLLLNLSFWIEWILFFSWLLYERQWISIIYTLLVLIFGSLLASLLVLPSLIFQIPVDYKIYPEKTNKRKVCISVILEYFVRNLGMYTWAYIITYVFSNSLPHDGLFLTLAIMVLSTSPFILSLKKSMSISWVITIISYKFSIFTSMVIFLLLNWSLAISLLIGLVLMTLFTMIGLWEKLEGDSWKEYLK